MSTPQFPQHSSSEGESSPTPPQIPQQVRIQFPQIQPITTYAIIAATVLVFIAQNASQALTGYDYPLLFGIKSNPAIDAGEYWRLFTPMLLHGNILHIGFNMYATYLLGRALERFYGHWKFLLLYILSGFTGGLASYLLTPSPSLGASTATFGLLTAYGVFAYRNKKIFGSRSKLMVRNVLQVAVLNLVIGLSPGIDNWAHLGGVLGGVALAWFAGPEFEVAGASLVDLHLQNKRTDQQFWLVFLSLFVLTAFIAVFFPGAA